MRGKWIGGSKEEGREEYRRTREEEKEGEGMKTEKEGERERWEEEGRKGKRKSDK